MTWQVRLFVNFRLLSRRTSAGIRRLVDEHGYPDYYKTTAWFLELTGKWVELISNRTPSLALSLKNPEKFNETVEFLKEYMDIIDSTKITRKQKDGRYPLQKGILLTTSSFIDASFDLLTTHGYDKVYSSHFGTECQESDFSRIRTNTNNKAPTPRELKKAMKVLSVVRSLKPSLHANCEEDGSKFLTSLANAKAMRASKRQEEEEDDYVEVPEAPAFTEQLEIEDPKHVLLMGYVLLETVCKQSKCEICSSVFTSNQPTKVYHRFVKECDFTGKALCYATEAGYMMFSACEAIFQANKDKMYQKKWLINKFSKAAVKRVKESMPDLPQCHLTIVIKRYFKIRLNKWTAQEKRRILKPIQKELLGLANSSLSMAGHSQLRK